MGMREKPQEKVARRYNNITNQFTDLTEALADLFNTQATMEKQIAEKDKQIEQLTKALDKALELGHLDKDRVMKAVDEKPEDKQKVVSA